MNLNIKNNAQRPWYLAWVIMFIVPLLGMNIDIYTPSLPWMVTSLHTSVHLVKLTIPFYLLGYAIGPLFFGPLSDRYGRKKILIYVLFIYILICLLIVLIASIQFILVMRVLQGFVIGALGMTYRAILSDVYPPGPEMHKIASTISIVFSLGPIVAPFVGGYLQHYFGWRANFIFLMVYAALVLLSLLILPETNKQTTPINLKILLRNYKMVLSHRLLWAAAICMGGMYILLIIFNIVAPFFIQTVLGFSAIDFGHIALLIGVTCLIGLSLNRVLIEKYPIKPLILTGFILMLLSSIIMLLLGLFFKANIWRFMIPVLLVIFFSFPIFPAMFAKSIALFPKMAGAANAMIGFLFMVMTGVAAILSSFLATSTQIPLALSYIAILIFCFSIYLATVK